MSIAMKRLSRLKQRKRSLFALVFVLAGLLFYVGAQIGIDMGLQFNAGGYSYLYYGGVNATGTFAVANPFTDSEKSELSGYLRQANLLPSDSTEQKIIKLSKFILDRLDDTRGVPERSWYQKGKYEQFQMVWNKQLSGIFCTQFRLVYTRLANEAGIPTRVIHSRVAILPRSNKWIERKGVGTHNFSESYIIESGQWAHVDLNEKIILMRDTDGNFINTVDLYDIYMGNKQGDHWNAFYRQIEVATYDSSTQTVRQEHLGSRDDFVDFFSEQTQYPLFFHENQIFHYERNNREMYMFKPYVVVSRVGRISYALAGAGVLLALVSCVYFIWPLLARVRNRLGQSA